MNDEPVEKKLASLTDEVLNEVKSRVQDLLGTQDFDVDRDKLWEIEYLAIQLRLVDAATRADSNAVFVLLELRERLIDRRFPLTESYLKEKEEIDNRYKAELERLGRKAASNDFFRQQYMQRLFEWMMERMKLQDKWVRGHNPLKIVASVFFGKKEEVGEDGT